MASPTQQRPRYRHASKRAPGWASTQHVYRPRRPTTTPLYPVVQHHLETFLAEAAQSDPRGYGVPSWVEKDLRAYLRCGILAHGFARLRCSGCGHERLLAFSCKSRGICPSCNTRRMAEVAAHVTEHVLPQLPVRQWVLSVPKRLRPFLETNPDIAGAVLRIFIRAMRTTLYRTSPVGYPSRHRMVARNSCSLPSSFSLDSFASSHRHASIATDTMGYSRRMPSSALPSSTSADPKPRYPLPSR